jgi:hypothetical protein
MRIGPKSPLMLAGFLFRRSKYAFGPGNFAALVILRVSPREAFADHVHIDGDLGSNVDVGDFMAGPVPFEHLDGYRFAVYFGGQRLAGLRPEWLFRLRRVDPGKPDVVLRVSFVVEHLERIAVNDFQNSPRVGISGAFGVDRGRDGENEGQHENGAAVKHGGILVDNLIAAENSFLGKARIEFLCKPVFAVGFLCRAGFLCKAGFASEPPGCLKSRGSA